MTPLSPLLPDQWDKRLDQVKSDMNGKPINVHRLMAHNPGLLKAWWDFRNYSVTGGTLGNRLGELVILRVGVHLGSWYEWGSHVDRSLRCGLSLEEIRRVLQPGVGEEWAAPEAALLNGVDCLIAEQRLSETALNDLEAHFDTPQIFDIIAIHGMYLILGCMIRTWGLDLDPEVAARIAPHGTQAEFEAAAKAFKG